MVAIRLNEVAPDGTFQVVTYGRLKLIQRTAQRGGVGDRPDYNSILALASRSRSRFTPKRIEFAKGGSCYGREGVVRPDSASPAALR